eukprot:1151163-Amphidinium_carterae.3
MVPPACALFSLVGGLDANHGMEVQIHLPLDTPHAWEAVFLRTTKHQGVNGRGFETKKHANLILARLLRLPTDERCWKAMLEN